MCTYKNIYFKLKIVGKNIVLAVYGEIMIVAFHVVSISRQSIQMVSYTTKTKILKVVQMTRYLSLIHI